MRSSAESPRPSLRSTLMSPDKGTGFSHSPSMSELGQSLKSFDTIRRTSSPPTGVSTKKSGTGTRIISVRRVAAKGPRPNAERACGWSYKGLWPRRRLADAEKACGRGCRSRWQKTAARSLRPTLNRRTVAAIDSQQFPVRAGAPCVPRETIGVEFSHM